MYGNYEKKERELASLQIERERLIAMADDTRQLLAVMTESKEVATKLVKSHIIRADNLQKELEVLKQELADKSALEQKVMELTAALDRSKAELEAYRDSKSKGPKMVDRGVCCNELSSNILSNIPLFRYDQTNEQPSRNTEMTDSTYERELELDEAFQNLSLEDIDGKNGNSRIQELETRLYKLHDYLRSTEKAHYQKIKEMKEDILSLRSSAASSDTESVNISRIIDAGHIKFQGKIQPLDCSTDSENSLRMLNYSLIGKELSKSNSASPTMPKEGLPNIQYSETTAIDSDNTSEGMTDLTSDPNTASSQPQKSLKDPTLVVSHKDEEYSQKKNSYMQTLEELIQREMASLERLNKTNYLSNKTLYRQDFDSEEVVQNHLRLLEDCYPDIPPLPTSVYLRSDRQPNAIFKQPKCSSTYSIDNQTNQSLQSSNMIDGYQGKSKIDEEPLNLSRNDRHDGQLDTNSPGSSDLMTDGWSESVEDSCSEPRAKKRPMPIDIPSIGTVAALSTAAVVSPVVAMACVGYGVVKILSGNQADSETSMTERISEVEEDIPCQDANENVERIPETNRAIVSEPQATANKPSINAGIGEGVKDPKTTAAAMNPFHNPQNPFLSSSMQSRQSGSYSSSSPLPDPLVPQPTSTSTKAAKQSSIKGLQELCKGLFWSTEDLSIPVRNKTEGEGELAIDSPWCTSDLANVHSRLKQLEESSQETLKEAANLSSGSNIRDEWRSEEDFGRNEDTSIRVFASNDAEIHTELRSTSYDTDEAAAFILTDDGRSIEGRYQTLKAFIPCYIDI